MDGAFFHAVASLSGLLRLSRGSPGGRAIAGEGNLGFSSACGSLRGPWMALSFTLSHPFRACSGFREARLEGEPSQARETLAFPPPAEACGGHGWRFLSRRRIPFGPAPAFARLAWRASHRRRGKPWLFLRLRKPAGAMDGPAGAPVSARAIAPRRGPTCSRCRRPRSPADNSRRPRLPRQTRPRRSCWCGSVLSTRCTSSA
jgi:hypothetical protein